MSSGPLIEARPIRVCEMADMKRKTLKNDQKDSRQKHVIQFNTPLNFAGKMWTIQARPNLTS